MTSTSCRWMGSGPADVTRSAAGRLLGATGARVGERRVGQGAVGVEQGLAVGADEVARRVEQRLAVGPQQRAVGGDLLGRHLLAAEGLALVADDLEQLRLG